MAAHYDLDPEVYDRQEAHAQEVGLGHFETDWDFIPADAFPPGTKEIPLWPMRLTRFESRTALEGR